MNATMIVKRVCSAGLLVAATLSLTACVEEDPNMELQAAAVYTGTAELSDQGKWDISCDTESQEAGNVERWFPRGRLDLGEVIEFGQVGDQPGVFWLHVEVVNDLVSTEGGSGSSEDFEGMESDQNSIEVTRVDIDYPAELNRFDGAEALVDLEKDYRFSAVLDSNEGALLPPVPLYDSGELETLREIHADLRNQHGLSEDASIEIVAEMTVRGETFSGNEVQSNKFEYPLDVTDVLDEDNPPGWAAVAEDVRKQAEDGEEDIETQDCLDRSMYVSTPYCEPEC